MDNTHIKKAGLRDVFLNFLHSEAFGGIFLFFAALLAMILANSSLREYYFAFWELDLGIEIKGLSSIGIGNENGFIGFTIKEWISDVLMSLFFLMVGLEIKREIFFGELASFKQAIFPALAALGGMIVPGLIYFVLNFGTESVHGFGIPMATDIAFALGVIMLLKHRVPMALKVFLVTLAVVDDLGAIVVIAVFYATDLHLTWLLFAGVLVLILIALNRLQVKILLPYLLIGIVLWFAIHHSGIHATIAAVILAFCIPLAPKTTPEDFNPLIKDLSDSFVNDNDKSNPFLNDSQIRALNDINENLSRVQSPLGRLETALHPWSAYFIMPLFGFANAGVSLGGDIDFSIDFVFLGVALGLIVGKPLGIFLTTFLCEKSGIASRPSGVSWLEIIGAGILAGIGFTMSIFVSDLAFKSTSHAEIATEVAKVSILSSSLMAGILGAIFLMIVSMVKKK